MGHWSLRQSGAPAVEPLSTADARTHLRVDISDEDDLIASLIKAARQQVEIFTGRQLITATYVLYLDEFPASDEILFPRPPLQSITSIAYLDTAGASQTLNASKYTTDIYSVPGRVWPAYGESWPSVRDTLNAITITFKAGYGDAATSVPAAIVEAIKLLVADMYEHREAQAETRLEVNETVQRLLWAYRVVEIR